MPARIEPVDLRHIRRREEATTEAAHAEVLVRKGPLRDWDEYNMEPKAEFYELLFVNVCKNERAAIVTLDMARER